MAITTSDRAPVHYPSSHPSRFVFDYQRGLLRLRLRLRLHLFQPHQADQMFDPHLTGSSYASKQ